MSLFVKCIGGSFGAYETRMFSKGQLYKVVNININGSYTIKDNLGCQRCIGTDFSFPVQGDKILRESGNHKIFFKEV